MYTKVIKTLGLILQTIVFIVSFFVPKNQNIWIFGSWTGNTFSDNSKYMYLYTRRSHPEIRCVYICKDKKIVAKLKKKNMEAYGYYSVKGCLLSMRAGYAFLTAAHCDVNSFCCARIHYIQLFHGTPLKKIYYDDCFALRSQNKWKEFLVKHIFTFLDSVNQKDYITIASNNVGRTFETAFRTKPEKLWITGLARTDAYFHPLKNSYMERLRKNIDGPLIVYLPTHRNYGNHTSETIDIMRNLKLMNELLKKKNLYMLYKPHYNELRNWNKNVTEYKHIIIPHQSITMSDVYSFTPYCDLLITDYSSIYYDFLLTEKPIVFFPYDFEYYITKEQHLYYRYEEVTPGPKCYSWEETIRAASRLLERDDYLEQRRKVKLFFQDYSDGRSCERIYQKIKNEILRE